MWGRLKTFVLAAVVAAAALVPLFGDPRQTPVTHPLWARMLLRSLDMTDAVRASSQASQVFAALAPRDSLTYPADRFLRAEGASVSGEGSGFGACARERARPRSASRSPWPSPATTTCAPGSRAWEGRPRPPSCGRSPGANRSRASRSFPPSRPAGSRPGAPTSTPEPTPPSSCCRRARRLSQIEVAPPCVNAIEPANGWQATGVTSSDDLAITALKAIDVEHELPPDATPIELSGDAFQVEAPDDRRRGAGARPRASRR